METYYWVVKEPQVNLVNKNKQSVNPNRKRMKEKVLKLTTVQNRSQSNSSK